MRTRTYHRLHGSYGFFLIPRGVMVPPHNQLTEDGYDLQWGTNVIGSLNSPNPYLPRISSDNLRL